MSVFKQDIDPNQQQIMQLQQQLQNMQKTQMSNRQMSEQQQSDAIHGEIETFANQADKTGKQKHPYFENVKPLMASLIESGQVDGLEQAYDMAVKAHPDTSALVASEQSQQENAKRQAEAKKKADKVKKAKATNLDTSPNDSAPKVLNKDLRQTLSGTFDKMAT